MPTLNAYNLCEWTGGQWHGGVPVALSGVCTDTRALRRGALFVALRGANFDGHAFIAEAFRRGAAGAVVQDAGLCATPTMPLLLVGNTNCALLDMAAGYRRWLNPEIVAVTGSVGKTTVKEMVADVLARCNPTARTRGNWNNEVGLPLSLLAMEAGARMGVFELGMNHPGELAPLARRLAPNCGLVTAIGPVHIEYFKSLAAIAREKGELLRVLPPNGTAFLSRENIFFKKLAAMADCRVVSVSLRQAADYYARIESEAGEVTFFERAGGASLRLHLPLPGRHQALNALFAVAVGRTYGVGWDDIRAALEAFNGQPMRWERQTIGGVTVINDAYNANPVSMAAALQTFATMQIPGRRWLVLAGMLELGGLERKMHRELGEALTRGPWAGLITVGALGKIIAEAALAKGLNAAKIYACADHDEAARVLRAQTNPADTVLLKASRGQRLERVLELWRSLV